MDSRHGAQNAYDEASKSTLHNEFDTSNEDECMTKILEKGDIQHTEVRLSVRSRGMGIELANMLLCRAESGKDPRTTPWALALLTEPFQKGNRADTSTPPAGLAASSGRLRERH